MQFNPGFSSLAALLADPGRAQMIWALMDGSARPASELALLAGVSPSSASGHLGRLVEGGVLSLEARGRNRFYRLAGPEVGQAVEALASASLALQPQRRSLPPSHGTPSALREARTCYDHLAGELAVGVFARMLDAGWIEQEGRTLRLSATGEAGLARLGIDLAEVRRRRRQFACACPDWSERKPHLGGALGAALLEACLRQGWLRPQDGSRALQVSSKGRAGLRGRAERTAG
ncbi:helix-turn-helix transcriptional regulator [Pseudomonas aeruginosa]|uniref:ArsR/SmtB family transcription factor n=1 Tax=Pseudomonas aeruginosa TaxID=287 RepID=UPI0018C8432E|nr:helix-turn-helix transcriptional regulator [Pseudomonas aeruginosa]MBG4319115.1 helix-turn-helix transcriptional regulator [Pseudomonas aeruginosa]MCV4386081.1 ArsR family transcriptional regulator [Pseudomonas aeruginosa]